MADAPEEHGRTADILRMAVPFPGADYIGRHEFTSALHGIETKIVNSELRQRNWVLGGCLAIILAFGSGYMSLVSKIDRLTDALPGLVVVQDGRRSWNLHQDQRLDQQDDVLRQLKPAYRPMPYVEPPK